MPREFDDKARAQYAAQILTNPVFEDACDVIEREVIEAWEACPARDMEGKERLWQLYKNAKKFKAVFIGYVEAGKLADLREKEAKLSIPDRVTKLFRGQS